MKYFLLVSSLLIVQFSFAQVPVETIPVPKPKLRIGYYAAPLLSYRSLFEKDPDEGTAVVVSGRNGMEIPRMGFMSGTTVMYQISPFWGVEAGVGYAYRGYKTKELQLDIMNSPGEPSKVWTDYKYHQVQVPVKAYAILGVKKVKIIGSLGTSTNILVGKKLSSHYTWSDGSKTTETRNSEFDFRTVTISGIQTAGILIDITSFLSVKIEEVIVHDITRIIDTPVSGYLFDVGINAGIYMSL